MKNINSHKDAYVKSIYLLTANKYKNLNYSEVLEHFTNKLNDLLSLYTEDCERRIELQYLYKTYIIPLLIDNIEEHDELFIDDSTSKGSDNLSESQETCSEESAEFTDPESQTQIDD